MQILYFTSISSTNSQLKELLCVQDLEEFSVVQAGFQSAGRGQKGNFWESEAGENLTFSVLLKPTFIPIHKQFVLSQIVSLALKDTLDIYISDVRIKWPNDIYYQDSKICGMLIENILDDNSIVSCIVGIGLNVNQLVFESDAPNPVSISNILGRKIDKDILLDTFLQKLINLYDQMKDNRNLTHIRDRYFSSLYRGKGEYLFEDVKGCFYGSVKEVDEEGFFYLKKAASGEICRYAFKEVRYIL